MSRDAGEGIAAVVGAAAVVAVVADVADVVAVDAAVSAAPNGGLTPHMYLVCTTPRVDFGCVKKGKRLPHGGCCTKKGADGEKRPADGIGWASSVPKGSPGVVGTNTATVRSRGAMSKCDAG